jgi:hypothetical protein
MSDGERQRLEEEQLKEEIVELRGELGETVEALVYKADIPARAKERGAELTERAIDRGAELTERAIDRGAELTERAVDRGAELRQQAVERGNEFSAQAMEWYAKFKTQAAERGSDLRDQAVIATERARQAVYQMPPDRWAKVACAGVALITMMIIMRRIRTAQRT